MSEGRQEAPPDMTTAAREAIAERRARVKACNKAYREANREKRRQQQRAYDRYRRESGKKWESTDQRPTRRNPRDVARRHFQNAIRKGNILRPPRCSACGVVCVPEGHHPDYTKPLAVLWLCKACHVVEHGGDFALGRRKKKETT